MAVLLAGGERALARFRNAANPQDPLPTTPISTSTASEWAAIAVIAAVLVLVIPFHTTRTYSELAASALTSDSDGHAVRRGGREFLLGSAEQAGQAQEVVDALDARAMAGERLVVAPEDLGRTVYSEAWMYNLFPELAPGTRYIEMDPGIADSADSGLAEEVEAANWLVLSKTFNEWSEPNESTEQGSNAAAEAVENHFCTVVENDKYELLERCAEPG
jgi:hypothetical protein